MAQHLIRRNGRYSYRRRIPADLIHAYKGKTEIVRALGTADPKEANRAANKLAGELDDEFERLRHGPKVEAVPGSYWDGLPREQVEVEEEEDRQAFEDDLHEQNLATLEEAVSRVLARQAATGSPAIAQTISTSPPATQTAQSAPTAGIGLPEVVRMWEKAKKPRADTAARMHGIVSGFFDAVGRHPVKAITRQHMLAYQAAQLASVTPTSARTKLAMIRALLTVAVEAQIIATNPASGIRTDVIESAKSRRQAFTKTDINTVFSSPVYSQGKRPKPAGGEAAYWLPILALYTGARLEELGQLAPSDVRMESYTTADEVELSVPVIYLTDEGENQELKNQASRRRIPVHPVLIEQGFMRYVEKQKGSRLFPALQPNKFGKETASFSRWFGMYLRAECGISDKRKTFHSFRHTFKDAMREAGVPEDVSDALSGHTNGSVSRNYGSSYYPLRPLVEAIERYRVSGVQLPSKSNAMTRG